MLDIKLVVLMLVARCIHIYGQNINQFNSLCTLTKDGTMLTDPSSCESYYLCANGVATLESCGIDKGFNKDQQACVAASQVYCQTPDSNPCAGTVDSWVPNSSNCNAYYYCDTNSDAHAQNCPSGQDFDEATLNCVYPSDSSCITDDTTIDAENVCLFVPNGQFFGSASNCSTYNYCQNNELSTASCADLNSNYVYNVQTQSCAYAGSYTCTQTANPTPSEVGGECTTAGSTTAITLANAPCNEYYTCNGTYYIYTTCKTAGEFYDTDTGSCTSETNAVNSNCNRCANHNKGFVACPTAPTDYYTCSNGQVTSNTPSTCTDNLYFQQDLQACVSENPNYPCCTGNSSGESTGTTIATTTVLTTVA